MADIPIFPIQAPLRDLLSTGLYADGVMENESLSID